MLKHKYLIAAATLAGALLFTAPASAGTLFSMVSTNAAPGDIGDAFDVLITNTGLASVGVAGFSFEIIASSADITFTDITTATVNDPYIFSGNSLFGPDIVLGSPGQTLDASDIANTPGSSATIAPGATFGLGRVFFNVAPSASAPETVTISFNSANSSLSDANGNPITINTFQSGTIVVVPEPSAAVLVAAGIALLWLRRYRSAHS